ncbi:hypothetical protein [Stenotrophomonas indicatrix]|uniref:hypothetical protein n=1 Tax=Stenotrophomonas indicatrix TaxID=2045451 RepID=UPI002003DB07|nr:hypothetical protein [Stenotrophomonas indicatrix]MCK6233141.1 hypothetical protein [Stenotrophomonas indicatrix]
MTVEITESGVTFGPFPDEDVYAVESCPSATALGANIKRVEFIVRLDAGQRDKFSLVEAKSSIPRATESFWTEILEKFQHSLLIWSWGASGRHSNVHAALPAVFKEEGWWNKDIEFILVIPGAPDHMLPTFSDQFRGLALGFYRASGIDFSRIVVLNHDHAHRHGLCAAPPLKQAH